MVCQECTKKIEKTQKLITPEFTKKNSNYNLSSSERKVNQNMILNSRSHIFDPMLVNCFMCKGRVEGKNKYCLTCAYTKGICEMCGVKVSDNKLYKFTDVDIKDAKRKIKMRQKTVEISNKILKEKNMIKNNNTQAKSRARVKISSKKEKQQNIQNISDNTKPDNLTKDKVLLNDENYENDAYDEYDEIIKI